MYYHKRSIPKAIIKPMQHWKVQCLLQSRNKKLSIPNKIDIDFFLKIIQLNFSRDYVRYKQGKHKVLINYPKEKIMHQTTQHGIHASNCFQGVKSIIIDPLRKFETRFHLQKRSVFHRMRISKGIATSLDVKATTNRHHYSSR